MEMQLCNQLLSVMEEQVKVLGDLAALGKKKSQLLVEGNIQEVDLLLRGEQALIWRMGRLEERRVQAQLGLAEQLGINASQLTLERLVSAVDPADVDRCHSVVEIYGQLARELTQVNQLNTELIQQAMAYVDFSLQLLDGTTPGGAQVYSPQGPRTAADAKRRRLDSRF